jgi:predicted permease
MREVWTDLRYAARTLGRSPLFAAVAILSLALGIGANTAVFSLLDQVMLRRLPVKDPEQLVLLKWTGSYYGSNTGMNALSYPLYKDFRDRSQVFSGVICRYMLPLSVGVQGQTERTFGELVSGNYFQVLGVGAAIGRTITPEDDRESGPNPVAVLSYSYWVERFGRDPNIVGRELIVNGNRLTVIGVSEAGFDGTEAGMPFRMHIPVTMKKQMTPGRDSYSLENRRGRWVNVFGRLKPGITPAQAKASLQPLFHSVLEMEVQQKEFSRAAASTRKQFLRSSIDVLPGSRGGVVLGTLAGTPLWILMALVGLVLLIACANVANLMMARASWRRKEIAVRLAVGAGRFRLVRQLMVESLFMAIAGGAAGVLLAYWADRFLVSFVPPDIPARLSAAPDTHVLMFALAASVLTGIMFGLTPALQATRVDLHSALKEEGTAIAGSAHARVRKLLVVAQIALSLLLLIGAGLFIRSLRNLGNLDPGFRSADVVAFSVDPSLSGYTPAQARLFYRQLTERLRAIPGVESASLALVRILNFGEWDNTVTVEGYEPKPGEDMSPFYNAVSPGYFATLGIAIMEGRDFAAADAGTAHMVGIVNQKFARRYFGDRSPIGRHFGFGGDPGTRTDIEIVGVVRDAVYQNMRDPIPRQVFIPYEQRDNFREMAAYVRTRQDPRRVQAAIRGIVHGMDPNLPVYDMRTMAAQVELSLIFDRLVTFLATVFGVLATVLAAIGLYGVMAYSVVRRTREIGLRMALGASNRRVLWLVMREALLLFGAGTAVALPCAWGLTRLLRAQLYGIAPGDPLSLALATLALTAVGAFSGCIPAFRAARIDPVGALKYE